MSEQKPEAVWVFPDEPPRRGRGVLIALIVVAVLVVAAVLAFFLIPRGTGSPSPTGSPTSSASPSPTTKPSPSPSATTTGAPLPTPTAPQTTPPQPGDPSVEVFRGIVQPRLDDARTGLGMISAQPGEGGPVVDQLLQDAQRLSDAVPPSGIADQWRSALSDYSQSLSDVRAALNGGDTGGAVAAAQQKVTTLLSLVGA